MNRKYYNHRSYCQSICLLSHLLLVVLGLLSAGCLDLVLPVPTNNTKSKNCFLLFSVFSTGEVKVLSLIFGWLLPAAWRDLPPLPPPSSELRLDMLLPLPRLPPNI